MRISENFIIIFSDKKQRLTRNKPVQAAENFFQFYTRGISIGIPP